MKKNTFLILLAILVLVNLTGLFSDIFYPDSALYAAISEGLVSSGDYWNLYVNGVDWLDKPHFPFWVCALFIKVFGPNVFAYKIPSILFFFIGLFYTYKLAKKIYNVQVAYIATLILGSSLHIVLSNNDVKAESILLGLVMAAMYYLYELKLHFSIKNIVLAALFSAAAVMTKGIFVLIIFYSALFLDMVVHKKYREIFHLRWILALVLTFLFIAPEIYALYVQFDLHPEKEVFGKNNVSGIQFFLWDSQFGRFFSTGPIKKVSGDPFFFLTTMLWAFAPWAFVGLYSLFLSIKKLIKKSYSQEYITFFGFSVMFLVFSLSNFQLNHYINILYPFLAILIANVLVNHSEKLAQKVLKISVNTYTVVFVIFIAALEYLFRTGRPFVAVVSLLPIVILFVYVNFKKPPFQQKFLVLGIVTTLLSFIFFNLAFYPKLLGYLSGTKMAEYTKTHYPDHAIYTNFDNWLLDFYTERPILYIKTVDELKQEVHSKNIVVTCDEDFLTELKESNIQYKVIEVFDNYRITRLNLTFVNHKTRAEKLAKHYLVEIQKF